MGRAKAISLVAAALVAGLVLGSVGLASAATAQTPGTGFGGGFGGICRQAGASLVDIVAKLTGKSTADVYAERQSGKTFADIAAEKGVTTDQVAKAALDARKAALAAAVKDGRITQSQADTMLSRMQTRIDARIDSTGGCGGGFGGGRGGAGRGFGGGCGAWAGQQ